MFDRVCLHIVKFHVVYGFSILHNFTCGFICVCEILTFTVVKMFWLVIHLKVLVAVAILEQGH